MAEPLMGEPLMGEPLTNWLVDAVDEASPGTTR
jgi:hypothetical protein